MTKKLNDILGSAREQINELSRKTLGSYTKKAVTDLAARSVNLGLNVAHSTSNKLEGKPTEYQDKNIQHNTVKMSKRLTGISRSLDKLAKEEVENIDEMGINSWTKPFKNSQTREYTHEPPMRVADKTTGRKGTVHKSYKEPTFSRMVPLTPPLRQVKWDDDGSREERRDHTIKKIKEDITEAKAVDLKSQAKELSNKIDSIVLKGGKVDYNDPLNVKLSNLRKKIAATKKK